MKTKLLLIAFACIPFLGIGQDENETLSKNKLIKNIGFQSFDLSENDAIGIEFDDSKIKDFHDFLKIVDKVNDLNGMSGSIKFGITGNESDESDLYVIQSGMEFNSGLFPLNVEASMNIQTQIQNGNFEEVVSNIDLSVDYLSANTYNEGYAFVKRTRNTFLGIGQRYEIGGGYVANLYKSTLKKGRALSEKIDSFGEKYDKETLEESKYYKHLKKTFDEDEIESLFTDIEKYNNIIKVRYSRYRFAFLIGMNTEVEQTQEDLKLYGPEVPITNTFEATTIFRLIVAPKFQLRGDKFKWSNTLFGKIRIAGDSDAFVDNSNLVITDPNDFRESELADFWIQFDSNFELKLSKTLSFVASINYIYDNAPKRQFYTENNTTQLAFAEQRYFGTTMSLKYSF